MYYESVKLGLNIRNLRLKKDISQVYIANELGVAKSFISVLEKGNANPTLTTITRIAKALGVSVNELF